MKSKLTRNALMKLGSLLAAIIIWVVVMNIEDPVNVRTYSNVAVTIKNDNIITDDNQTYQVVDNLYTISVTVEARRSVLKKITSSDIVATADFNNLTLGKLIPINVSIPNFEGECESISANPQNLQILIENEEQIKLPVTVEQSGEPQDGYYVSSITTIPDSVTITGGKSVLSTIDKALVNVDVSGFTTDTSVNEVLKLYDKDGKEVDTTGLEFDIDISKITCDVKVSQNKDVSIEAKYTGSPAKGYEVSEIKCEPAKVAISGDDEVIKKLDSIIIPESAIDISDATHSLELTIDIGDYLPDGVKLADESNGKILVTIIITKESE